MKVTVDQGRCVSAGNCVAHAPEVFDQDEDDGSVILLDEHPSEDLLGGVQEAVAACPAQAIQLSE